MSLEEIRGRLDAATPGPWRIDEHDPTAFESIVSTANDAPWGWVEVARSLDKDAEFIAHAPEDMRRLLNAVENVLERCEHMDRSKPVGDWYYYEITGAIARALEGDR